jgi:hypothetical protein
VASGYLLGLAIAVAVATAAAVTVLAAALGHVWQQSQLTRTLHGTRDLVLVPPARTRDPAGANLPAI